MLQRGDCIPAVLLRDTSGEQVALQSLRGAPLVLYFYPKDDTPGCTMEACSFRDAYQDFTDVGAAVIGVSSDGPAAHARFAARYKLPFRLLTDERGAARKAFGVPKTFGILPGRVTFVIDGNGVILHVFNSAFMATKHVGEALSALRERGSP